jgi:hypothetical protein
VSEALSKTRPVVAGRVGGIPMQIPAGHERFLVDSRPGPPQPSRSAWPMPGKRSRASARGGQAVVPGNGAGRHIGGIGSELQTRRIPC